MNNLHKEIIRLRKEKLLTYKEIADELGCSYTLPHKVLKRNAPYLMDKCSTIIVKRNLPKIIKLRKNGLTYKEMGLKFGLKEDTIEGAIHKFAPELIKKPISQREQEQRIKKVVTLQRKRLTVNDISRQLSLSKGIVDGCLMKARKQGIPLIVKRRKYPRLTQTEIEKRDKEIVRLYESGVSAKELAEKYDIVFGRVYQIIWSEKPEINIDKRKEREKRNKEIKRRAKTGKNLSEIAKEFGISESTVRKIANEV